jgi:3-hydroxyacyl-[acyl-carrier-protein] dehydratase
VRFTLVDRITELTVGQSITAIKVLSLAEEYLADHFPRFPVMPGVMMLEAMYQASAWLVRSSEDFAHTIVVLREARNVKFSNFVEPGQVLVVQATMLKENETTTTLKAEASVNGKPAVNARLVLERYNLADRYPSRAATDDFTRRQLREQFDILCGPTAVEAGGEGEMTPV